MYSIKSASYLTILFCQYFQCVTTFSIVLKKTMFTRPYDWFCFLHVYRLSVCPFSCYSLISYRLTRPSMVQFKTLPLNCDTCRKISCLHCEVTLLHAILLVFVPKCHSRLRVTQQVYIYSSKLWNVMVYVSFYCCRNSDLKANLFKLRFQSGINERNLFFIRQGTFSTYFFILRIHFYLWVGSV